MAGKFPGVPDGGVPTDRLISLDHKEVWGQMGHLRESPLVVQVCKRGLVASEGKRT